jgi:hypothetical protein
MSTWRPALGLTAVLSMSACAATARLVADDGSHRMKGADGPSRISVVLTTDAWGGEELLDEEITAVHLLVANMGDAPVLLAPGDFELRDVRGFRYKLYDAGGSFAAVPAGGDPATFESAGYDPGRSTDYRSIRGDFPELSRDALPWGVLEPGTQMRGFVYFERVVDTANQATLTWHAQRPDHTPVADFAFALHVARVDD